MDNPDNPEAQYLLLISLTSIGIALLIAALGLAWALFAALICGLRARSSGLNITVYTVAGAVYSLLFLLPWVYLIAWMYNRHIPRAYVISVYVIMYGFIWLLGPMLLHMLGAFVGGGFLILQILLPFHLLVYGVSLIMLLVKERRSQREILLTSKKEELPSKGTEHTSVQRSVLPHYMYLVPFALLWLMIPGSWLISHVIPR